MSKFVMIVGTVSYQDLNRVRRYVRSLPPETVVITGNGMGVCSVVRSEAQECGLGILQFYRLGDSEAEKERWFSRMVKHADIIVRYKDDMANNQTRMTLQGERFLRQVIVNPEFWGQS